MKGLGRLEGNTASLLVEGDRGNIDGGGVALGEEKDTLQSEIRRVEDKL